jgi:hypothetical protein
VIYVGKLHVRNSPWFLFRASNRCSKGSLQPSG